MKNLPNEWLKIAEEDIDTARYCFEGKKYLWSLFMCQQAVEKAIKAIYTKNTGEIPPKKHDLIALAGIANILQECNKETRDLFRRLSRYYIKARYPESRDEIEAKANQENTKELFEKSKEIISWLKSKLNT